jgi:hypothetical protein
MKRGVEYDEHGEGGNTSESLFLISDGLGLEGVTNCGKNLAYTSMPGL